MSEDRNERARREFFGRQQAAQAERHTRDAYALAAERGEVVVLDRFSRPVTPGTLVVYRPPYDLIFVVTETTPVLDPRQPPGLVRVVLTATAPLVFSAGQPIIPMIVVGQQSADGQHATITGAGGVGEPPTPEAPDNGGDHGPDD